MRKIGIIGDRNSVLGFMALGFAVHEVNKSDEAAEKLHQLTKTDEYAVIFITEDLAMKNCCHSFRQEKKRTILRTG